MRGQWRIVWYRNCYGVVFYDAKGNRHRRSCGTTDKREAERLAPGIISAATAERKQTYTAGQILEMYLEQSEAIGRDILAFHAKPVAAALGGFLAQDVGHRVRAYIAGRRGSVKPGTIRKELGLLRASLNWAEKHGHIEKAPFIQLPPAPAPRDRRLTREEMTALEAECRQAHLLLFVLIARYTAARAGAILSMRWSQVDFDRRQIDLGGDGRQKRRAIVPMSPYLSFALAIAKTAAMTPFVIEYAGRRVTSIKKGFAAACARAGIRSASPHVLRHTAASWMAEGGVSMDEIAQFLGHTNPSVTFRTYARFSPTYLRKAVEALD